MIDAGEALLRPALWVLRGAWWLIWELLFELVAWWVGWPLCRLLSLGRFPSAGWAHPDDDARWENLAVSLVGVGVLVLALLLSLP